ncbi:MAG: HesA/MoeB/ThiF family protein [Nitrospiraceae bacterium]|nr:HesA/MoeB/ThiF family protein [Nitrospiraceae bacterium]
MSEGALSPNKMVPELERYRRQLMLEGFTPEHQKRLKASSVLVAGVGGVGGTAALYLAVAGVGKLVLVHSGQLTLSNMNRQILMRDSGIGQSRVQQAKKTIEEINPAVAVEIHDERFTPALADALLNGSGVAISARPNFGERRVLNESCVRKGVPMVEGAMNGMEGYLFTVVPFKGPCLNCLYPEDNPEWQELGFPVMGAVSGTLGCLMAMETIKVLTGFGRPMTSHMLAFDMLSMDFKKLKIARDKGCAVCGQPDKA